MKKFGTIDILVNNAGKTEGMPFLESTKEHWITQFEDNFFGTVMCSKEAAKIMVKKKSGKIINVASIRGMPEYGREGIMAYSAAKAAVISFTKTLAKEISPYVLVNAVAPGFVRTRNYDNIADKVKKSFIESTKINRFIEPDEIADAIVFIAKNDAMTGEVVVVDGGFVLK